MTHDHLQIELDELLFFLEKVKIKYKADESIKKFKWVLKYIIFINNIYILHPQLDFNKHFLLNYFPS